VLAAQDAVQPPVKAYASSAASNNAASKVDIFVGFSVCVRPSTRLTGTG
jgi:hypothetical protein